MTYTLVPFILTVAVLSFYINRAFKKPRHDREWCEHHRALPSIHIDEDGTAHVRNIRHARYRAEFDFDLSYTDESYNTHAIKNVWFYVSHWDLGQAHCILSFEFEDGRYLASSVEVRKVHAKSFKTQDVLYGNYEIFYILADELDVISLRSHIWGPTNSDLHLYKLALTPALRRKTFIAMADRINHFNAQPHWYRVTHRNCATEPMLSLRRAGTSLPRWHWRYIMAGFIDRALYKYHLINTEHPFAEVFKKSDITAHAAQLPLDETFSRRLRETLEYN